MASHDHQTEIFENARPRLMRLAYRMLGDVARAEDVVQNTWLRWRKVPIDTIGDPTAWLAKVASRLAIDELRAGRHRREIYVGPFLPEPVTPEAEPWAKAPDGETALGIADDLSVALFLLLERLSPDERAAFLLREAFDADYADIAGVIGKSESACRKIVERARTHVAAGRPRYRVDAKTHRALFDTIMAASFAGDVEAVKRHFARDAVLISDGGGKRIAALNPIHGDDRIARFLVGTSRRLDLADIQVAEAEINGAPAMVIGNAGTPEMTISFDLDDRGQIVSVYIVRNPDKLARIALAPS